MDSIEINNQLIFKGLGRTDPPKVKTLGADQQPLRENIQYSESGGFDDSAEKTPVQPRIQAGESFETKLRLRAFTRSPIY